jgi:hypothetical protein
MSTYYVTVSALIFALVAVVQLVRLSQRWTVQIGSHSIPLAVSWVALAVAGAMSVWGISQLM